MLYNGLIEAAVLQPNVTNTGQNWHFSGMLLRAVSQL